MKNSEAEKLFYDMYKCNDEDSLHRIVVKNKWLKDPNNWKPYGGTRGNFATFENQQNEPIASLVEKITNSFDAILLRKCRELKIDPTSKEAPKTMNEAVQTFFGLPHGNDWYKEKQEKIKELSDDIQLFVEGEKTNPSIVIYDRGEGQEPAKFDKTFLSLHTGNKANVKFAQGQFNMGSTGAVVFCGEKKYQLIASKRSPTITGDSDEFGFTLIRRHVMTPEEQDTYKTTYYEYFAPEGEIVGFPIKELDLGLKHRKFDYGTIVKMYSYDMNISKARIDLYFKLNRYLYEPALPFLIFDKREEYQNSGSDSIIVKGNKTRLHEDATKKIEERFTIDIKHPEIGKIPIEIIVLKSKTHRFEYVDDMPVLFTVNGQTHGFLRKRFISDTLGFHMIRDNLLIHVDCTNFDKNFRNDLFMASRDRLKESSRSKALKQILSDELRSNKRLRQINFDRKHANRPSDKNEKELIQEVMKNMPKEKIVMDLLEKHKNIELFKDQKDQDNKEEGRNKSSEQSKEEKKELKEFPTFLKAVSLKEEEGKKIKAIPLRGKGKIELLTDCENNYLTREKDPGKFFIKLYNVYRVEKKKMKKVEIDYEELFEIKREGPREGVIDLTLKINNKGVKSGDIIEMSAILTTSDEDLEEKFYVQIDTEVRVREKERKRKKKEEKEKNEDQLFSGPNALKVYKERIETEDLVLNEQDMSLTDVVKFEFEEEAIQTILINMDHPSLQKYITEHRLKTKTQIETVKNKYFTSMYVHSLYLYYLLKDILKDELVNMEVDEVLSKLLSAYSYVLLSFVDSDILKEIGELT